MVLKSKSFLIYKGDTLENITQYLSNEIGLNAFLIKDIQAVRLQDNLTQLTVLYNKYPSQIIDSIAPREGAIFTSDISSNDFDVRFLFNYPVDFRSITSGTFKIDGLGLDSSKIYLDPNSNNYFLKISASGSSFQTEDFHTYQIGSNLKRIDGSSFSYTPVGGYIFHDLSSAHIGDYFSNYDTRRRGTIAVGVLRLSKGLNPQQGVIEYLSQRQISDDRLISYYTVSTTDNSSDVYFIYLKKIEPQIVSGFPLNNSLLPDVSAPGKVTLVFNTKLDKSKLLSTSGLFTVESGFNTSVPVSTSHINLLDDLKTVEINVASYFTSQKVYSILARPGILGLDGLAKEKPEQWTIHISAYEKGVGGAGGAPVDAQYLLYSPDPDLDSAYIVTGDINIHIASTSNPHGTTAGQVGAPTTSQFTGHTGSSNNPHQVTAAQVGSPTLSVFNAHTGLTGIHFTVSEIRIPASQISDFSGAVAAITSSLSGVSNSTFSSHTGDTSIHFTEASINHINIQGIGTNTHTQIDTHLANTSNPHGTTAGQVGAPTTSDFTGHTGLTTIHFTVGSISHTAIQNIGSNTHAQIDTHIANTSNPHSTTAAQVGAPTTAEFTGHTGLTSVHFTQASISIPSTQISDFTEAVQDVVGVNTFARGASGITVTYDDTSNTLTFSMTGTVFTGTTGHIGNTSNPHGTTAAQVGAPTTAQFTGHTGLTNIHLTQAELDVVYQPLNDALTEISAAGNIAGGTLYLDSSKIFQTLPIGSEWDYYRVVGGMPTWTTGGSTGGGSVNALNDLNNVQATGNPRVFLGYNTANESWEGYTLSGAGTVTVSQNNTTRAVTISGQATGLLPSNNFSDLGNFESGLSNLRQNYYIDDLFGVDYSQWSYTNAGDAATYVPNPNSFTNLSINNEVGFITAGLGAGTGSSNGTVAYHNQKSIFLQSGMAVYFKIYVNTVSNCKYRFGLTSNAAFGGTGIPSNGVYLELDTSLANSWYLHAVSGNVRASGSAILANATTHKWFCIYRGTTGYHAYDLSYNEISLVQVVSNLPPTTDKFCYPFIQSIGNGTAFASIVLDTIAYPMPYNKLPQNILIP